MFILFYNGGAVALRNPTLGDARRINTYVENRDTIGGELKSVKDSSWPNIVYRSFNFTALTLAMINELRTAFENSAGLEVTIIDHNNEIWTGVITSDINEIITVRDNCSYDVSFEFMGSYVEPSGVILLNDDNNPVYNPDEDLVEVI